MEALLGLLRRLVSWIGVVAALWYVGLYAAGYAVLRPDYLASRPAVSGFFDDFTTVKVGAWAIALSSVGLLWFVGGVVDHLRSSGEPRLARIALGGGVLGAGAIVGGAALLWVGTLRFEDAGASRSEVVDLVILHDLSHALLFVAAPFGFGVAVLASAAAAARAGLTSVEITAVSAGLATALWIPWIARFAIWPWLLWVLCVALVLQRNHDGAGRGAGT